MVVISMRDIKQLKSLIDCLEYYLDYCLSHDESESTIIGKKCLLSRFVLWCSLNDIENIDGITLAVVEEYRLYARKNCKGKKGEPIQSESLRNIITAVKVFVKRMYFSEILDHDPLGRLELPKKPRSAYSGDGEHRFRFYREHLNSTHWVHDIFNLSVHDGQF